MDKISKRKLKSIKHMFREKDEYRKKNSEKFRHRAPSGDARKKESIVKLMAEKVDVMVIVASFTAPPLKTGLIDRFLVLAGVEDVEPVIVLNKTDLLESREEGEKTASLYRSLGYMVIPTSTVTGEGIELLKSMIEGRASLFAGHSGVGKSSIFRAAFPEMDELPEVSEVSLATKKGRHTTTTIKLYNPDPSTRIFDLPGIKYATFHDLDPVEIQCHFPEFISPARRCKYPDCRHVSEPSCGVKREVEEGFITRDRYDSYLRILTNP